MLSRLGRRLGISGPLASDSLANAYASFARERWSKRLEPIEKGVVLVGLGRTPAAVHCLAQTAVQVAASEEAALRTFHFGAEPWPVPEAIFSTFGAPSALSLAGASEDHRAAAAAHADEVFAGLKSKWDVLLIAPEQVPLGDLVYDAALRATGAATLKLDDPALRQAIFEALLVHRSAGDFFAEQNVRAVVIDAEAIDSAGVLLRVAASQQVPVFAVHLSPKFLVQRLRSDGPGRRTLWPRADYARIFADLTPEAQKSARERAAELLAEALKPVEPEDPEAPVEKLLGDSPRPRVLISLPDFSSAPHEQGRLLFPDLWEWSCFVLEQAEKAAEVDWFVKPHPLPASPVANAAALDSLLKRFPKRRLLEPWAPLRQLAEEKLRVVFTARGEDAAEFATLGVPVVTAGANPTQAFDFAIHARSTEELGRLIAAAGELRRDPIRSEVEAAVYMERLHFFEADAAEVHPIDPELAKPVLFGEAGSEFYERCRQSCTPEREAAVAAYLDSVLAG